MRATHAPLNLRLIGAAKEASAQCLSIDIFFAVGAAVSAAVAEAVIAFAWMRRGPFVTLGFAACRYERGKDAVGVA
jgi:hypothetical protein